MEEARRVLGSRSSWIGTRVAVAFVLIVTLSVMGILTALGLAAYLDRKSALAAGVMVMVGGALIVFHMGKFAYAVADDSGIYVQRWRTQRFVAWHDVRSIEFSLIREELVLRLRRPVGGYLEVIIPAGVTTPAGVSVGEYWAMLRGRSEPEPVAWVRARIERAKTENTGQYNVDPPTG